MLGVWDLIGTTTRYSPKPDPLFTNNLNKSALTSPSVKLAVKDSFPGTKIKLSVCYCDYYLSAHNLPFHVGVGVVLTHVVAILGDGLMRSQPFQPDLVVMMQTCFIVVDKHGGSDVHGIAEHKTFSDPTFSQALFNLGSDVDQGSPRRYLKPEFFAITFHGHPSLGNEYKELSVAALKP
jgi:hypothetical protein